MRRHMTNKRQYPAPCEPFSRKARTLNIWNSCLVLFPLPFPLSRITGYMDKVFSHQPEVPRQTMRRSIGSVFMSHLSHLSPLWSISSVSLSASSSSSSKVPRVRIKSDGSSIGDELPTEKTPISSMPWAYRPPQKSDFKSVSNWLKIGRMGIPAMAQQKQIWLVTMRMQVRPLTQWVKDLAWPSAVV